MPQFAGYNIENLTPLQARSRGYLTPDEARLSQEWIEENLAVRHSNTIVYVNGVYRCVATKTTALHKIVDKLRLPV